MQIRKSRGLGKIIEAAFEKEAGVWDAVKNFVNPQKAPAATRPGLSTGTPGSAQPPTTPAAGPQQSQLPIPAGPHGAALQQQWMKMMQESGPHIAKMGQWAQQMAKQPMVAKDPQFAEALNKFSQTIAQLPQNPQGVPQLQQQIQEMHQRLENFWLKWRDAYQRGHEFMNSSTQQLKAFEHFVDKKLNMKGFQNAATPIPQGPPPPGAAQNMGGFMV